MNCILSAEDIIMNYNFDKFEQKLLLLHLSMTDLMKNQFSQYYDLMCEWNKVMNLTAITEFDEVIEKHFLDSVALGAFIDLKHEKRIIDIGTGAGFPGIPLKILFPELDILLVDSLKKRIVFLNEVIQKLEISNICAVHGRAEDFAHKKDYREKYDLCVSRAVAHLSCLSEYCIPFVKRGGMFVAYKSAEITEELTQSERAIEILGGKLSKVEKFQLPDTEYGRSFVFIEKVNHTLKTYPRKAGTPVRCPL